MLFIEIRKMKNDNDNNDDMIMFFVVFFFFVVCFFWGVGVVLCAFYAFVTLIESFIFV